MPLSKIDSDSLNSGVPTRAQLPAGTVLQVVSGSTSTQVSSSSNVLADTGLTATITPLFASSNILVLVNHGTIARIGAGTPSQIAMEIILLRGASQIQLLGQNLMYFIYSTEGAAGAGYLEMSGPSTSVLDSPATTSPVTYKTQFRNSIGATNGVRVQASSSQSRIVLLEIAA